MLEYRAIGGRQASFSGVLWGQSGEEESRLGSSWKLLNLEEEGWGFVILISTLSAFGIFRD